MKPAVLDPHTHKTPFEAIAGGNSSCFWAPWGKKDPIDKYQLCYSLHIQLHPNKLHSVYSVHIQTIYVESKCTTKCV